MSSNQARDIEFSTKRFFLNNADSYHGKFILNELWRLSRPSEQPDSTEVTKSQTQMGGEDHVWILPSFTGEIIGTVGDSNVTKVDHLSRIISKEKPYLDMLSCGNIVLDISCDDDELKRVSEFIQILRKLFDQLDHDADPEPPEGETGDAEPAPTSMRNIILISTIMTWANTKPMDSENPDMPFLETDFRKRRPHPNYKQHFDVENEVIGLARKYKKHIRATVIGSGITYGGKEKVLYYWFQKAWECEPVLPILGKGGNFLPVIYVKDLALIVSNLLKDMPRKFYILAVEQTCSKQKELIKAIGNEFGSGLFKSIQKEEGYLITEISQRSYDHMTLNLNMEPGFIVEEMALEWSFEVPLKENIPVLIKQYTKERCLKKFRVIVHGPPLVGKTTVALRICDQYGLPYISPETIVQDTMADLEFRTNHWKMLEAQAAQRTSDDDEEEAEDEDAKQDVRTALALLKKGAVVTDDDILQYIRQRLLSHEAMNKGWVLDGFPTLYSQCKTLYEKRDEPDIEPEGDENDDELEAEMYENVLRKMLPDVVIYLDATDSFICNKAMMQKDGDPRFFEETVIHRLKGYRKTASSDNWSLNFYDEYFIHPLVIKVNDHQDYDLEVPYSDISLRLGPPSKYEKLMEKIRAAETKTKKEFDAMKDREQKLLAELEAKMKQDREEKMEYWSQLYSLLRDEEEQALAAAGEPMRHYLMKYIFPTLTSALLDVVKVRPEDPVDYLAEYLLKTNPTGRMLEPGYNFRAERLFGRLKVMDEALKSLDIKIEPLTPPDTVSESSDSSSSYW